MQTPRREPQGIASEGFASTSHAGASPAVATSDLIIDTHLHLWNLETQQLPWLADAPGVLNQTYGLDDYRVATTGLNVRALYMEVDVAEPTLDSEADLALALPGLPASPVLGAVIGGRPGSPGFPDYLRKYQSNPRFKGVRQVLLDSRTPAGYCLRHEFIRGVQLLGEVGKSFELCMRPVELMDGAELARRCAGTRLVLNHCGNPDLKCFRPLRNGETSPSHTADAWKRSIDALARCDNTICKISGIGAELSPGAGVEDLAPAINHCLDAFGPDRVVFGGDWPACLVGVTYRQWVEWLRQIIETRPVSTQSKLWSENAVKFYALNLT